MASTSAGVPAFLAKACALVEHKQHIAQKLCGPVMKIGTDLLKHPVVGKRLRLRRFLQRVLKLEIGSKQRLCTSSRRSRRRFSHPAP